ncbi:homoserine dehydrogenase [Tepidibacter aestuarii]|uniref:homoserine dehydrogenase n=1 Tax=Tepidibacter aestuarii TaxID=2925782 RepID=UPI0020BFF48C|nr:homoserine dehydrogenase [Tepidibacter aestuarii]CAH2213043.1 homoserine dehydrogenase [Tepidibacter aestuarii]
MFFIQIQMSFTERQIKDLIQERGIEMIKIGLLGFGTVGTGVYEIINNTENNLRRLLNKEIEVSKILVRDINKKRNVDAPKDIFTQNPLDILENPEIDIVVEVMGGIDKAYEYICLAFKNNKHVVTANKAVVSKYIDTFLELSNKYDKGFLFEASVGGGIPIIKPLKQSARINNISNVRGILNGTTNFILTKMCDENLSFDEALDMAKELGYAEADPTDDIQGYDVKRKLAILSSIAFNNKTDVDSIMCRGISSISKVDIKIFKKLGLVAKLVGSAVSNDNNYSASVEPVLLNEKSTFTTVKDAFNIVSITGNVIGELQFYGQGAGKNPTANAVVSDIFDIVTGQYKKDSFVQNGKLISADIDLFKGRYYIRVSPNNKSDISKILKLMDLDKFKYEILSMNEDLIVITDVVRADKIEQFLSKLNMLEKEYCYMRIEGDIMNLKYEAK